jgi:hypothetical protein
MTKLRLSISTLRHVLSETVKIIEAEKERWGVGPTHKPSGEPLRPEEYKGTGQVRHTGVKQKPSYDPQLPKQPGKSPGWLSIYEPNAYKALTAMGSPDGKIYLNGPYIMFRPNDATARTLFWAAVPEKRKLQGHAIEVPEGGEEKPFRWRPHEELSPDQKKMVDWLDPRDRAKSKVVKPEKEEELLGVRPRGGYSRGPLAGAYSEEGWLVPAEADVMGHVHGAEPYIPGVGGGLPSREAIQAMHAAFTSKGAKMPKLETLDVQDLKALWDVARDSYRASRFSSDARLMKQIEAEISKRSEEKQQTKQPHVSREPAVPAQKKQWSKTSKDVQIFTKPGKQKP